MSVPVSFPAIQWLSLILVLASSTISFVLTKTDGLTLEQKVQKLEANYVSYVQ